MRVHIDACLYPEDKSHVIIKKQEVDEFCTEIVLSDTYISLENGSRLYKHDHAYAFIAQSSNHEFEILTFVAKDEAELIVENIGINKDVNQLNVFNLGN